MPAAILRQEDLAQLFRALSDPTRLRILRLLAANRAEMCVCEFVDCLQERQYNVSRQLKVLEAAGLLAGKKEGRWVYYGLAAGSGAAVGAVQDMVAKLPATDAFEQDQRAFKSRMRLRTEGRCRVGIQTPELND